MSRGPGWIEKEIFKSLELGPISVYSISFRCHMVKRKRNKDKNLHSSVCRTVRRLEQENHLKSEKIPYKELDDEFVYRFNKMENYPNYVKMVWLDIRE
jgi:23S rRNA maturation mini-RNase III